MPVEKQQQINLQEKPQGRGRGRGRGGGGRGRTGRGGNKKKERAGDTAEYQEELWNEDMQKEWEKFKEGKDSGHWEWDDVFGSDGCENWSGDWSHPPKAWDRLACLDGKVSEHKLQDVQKEKKRKSNHSTKELETKVAQKEQDQNSTASTKKQRVDTGKELEKKKPEKKKVRDSKEDRDDKEKDEFAGVPRKLKDQTNEILNFLKKVHQKVPNSPEDLDDSIKLKLREDTPGSDDCRLNVYWKRPAVGIHLKSEKRDIGTYGLDSHNGSFGLRLAAVLKAASMLAPWNKFIWPIGNGNNKHRSYMDVNSEWQAFNACVCLYTNSLCFARSFSWISLYISFFLSLPQASFVSEVASRARESDERLGDDVEIAEMKASLKRAAARAVERFSI